MMRDVSMLADADDPVAVALNDPHVHVRITAAARAFLGRCGSGLTLIQRTEEAKVIVQEAACRAWKHRDRFDSSKDVVKWLVGFVLNVVREFAKKRGRDPTRLIDDSAGFDCIEPARPIEAILADKQLVGHLLGQLSKTDREITEMKVVDGLTCAEVGQRIGMNENAVRVRFFRIIGKLRQMCDVTGEGQS